MTTDLDLRARYAVAALRNSVDASLDEAASDEALAAVIEQVRGVVPMQRLPEKPNRRRWVVLAAVAAAALVLLVVLVRDHRPAPVVPVPTSIPSSTTTPTSNVASTTAPPTSVIDGGSDLGALPTVGPPIGGMGYPPQVFTLRDGRVVHVRQEGAGPTPLDVYDATTDTLTTLGTTVVSRFAPVAVELEDGRLLLVGGDYAPPIDGVSEPATLATAEIMDLATGKSVSIGSIPGLDANPRIVGTALPDGTVVILASGDDRAWVFDPTDDSFTLTGSRTLPAIEVGELFPMTDGRVLVLSTTPEVFDPASGTFTALSSALSADLGVSVLLQDGRVLAFRGSYCSEVHGSDAQGYSEGYQPSSSLILDPVKGELVVGPKAPHCVTSAAVLPSGRVFVAGYWWKDDREVNWSGVLDLATGETTLAGTPNRQYGTAVPLQDGRVLLVAGKATTWADVFVEDGSSP